MKREFFDQRFVYCLISQRAGGMSIGIDMCPDHRCNFDCIYCEIDRSKKARGSRHVNLDVMVKELERTLESVHSRQVQEHGYQSVPAELLELKEVALSGNGEPTLCPNFAKVVEKVVQFRALETFPFFKIVLFTNCSGLHLPEVQAGLRLLTDQDEVWAKLDAGTQQYSDRVNRSEVRIEHVLENILVLARKRPVIIQSLFALIDGQAPPKEEIEEYARQLLRLKEAGANIPLIQIYSAHRQAMNEGVAHLPLRTLSKIANRVQEVSGLKTEVF